MHASSYILRRNKNKKEIIIRIRKGIHIISRETFGLPKELEWGRHTGSQRVKPAKQSEYACILKRGVYPRPFSSSGVTTSVGLDRLTGCHNNFPGNFMGRYAYTPGPSYRTLTIKPTEFCTGAGTGLQLQDPRAEGAETDGDGVPPHRNGGHGRAMAHRWAGGDHFPTTPFLHTPPRPAPREVVT